MESLDVAQNARLLSRFAWELGPGQLTKERDRLDDVKELVRLAYERTRFYRNKFDLEGIHPNDIKSWADFAKIPTTTKDELIAAGETCLTSSKDEIDFVSCSSGSSGKRFSVYQDAGFWIQDSIIGIAEFRKRFDYRPMDVSLYANTSAYPYSSVGGMYRFRYFDNLLPARELLALLERERPAFLMTYPSIAEELVQHMRAIGHQATFQLKGIVTHSEQSTQSQRDGFAKFFRCGVYDEYATEELGRVAIQCRLQTYHLIESGSYCEVLRQGDDVAADEGEVGEIVGTCLINRAMPLIRYRQGDLAAVEQARCACGLGGRAITHLLGRKNDSFELPDGAKVSSGRLLDWTYSLFITSGQDIQHFQLVQVQPDRAVLRLVTGKTFRPATDVPMIVRSFQASFGPMLKLAVEQVSHIPRTASGKYLPIVRMQPQASTQAAAQAESPPAETASMQQPSGPKGRAGVRA